MADVTAGVFADLFNGGPSINDTAPAASELAAYFASFAAPTPNQALGATPALAPEPPGHAPDNKGEVFKILKVQPFPVV